MVREALADAVTKEREKIERPRPKLESAIPFIDTILKSDLQAPRKQRHTAHRIYDRLRAEQPEVQVSETTVRKYVRAKKLQIGLIHRETFVPQSYSWEHEGQVDWYEMFADLGGETQKVQMFCLRSMASAGAFHRNELLLEASQRDEHRMVGDRALCVGAAMAVEREHLLPLAKEGFRFPNGRRYSRMRGCAKRCWIG
jgi:hypothetical protein